MAIIPPFLPALVAPYLVQLFRWFSDLTYAALLTRYDDHLLHQLAKHLDCTPLERACTGWYTGTD